MILWLIVGISFTADIKLQTLHTLCNMSLCCAGRDVCMSFLQFTTVEASRKHNDSWLTWSTGGVTSARAWLFFRVCWTSPSTSWMWPSRPTATRMTMALQRASESSLSQRWAPPHVSKPPPYPPLQSVTGLILTLSFVFTNLLQKSLLFEHGIRRLTFLVAQKVRARIHISWSPCGFYSLLPCMLTVKQFWTACLKLSTQVTLINMQVSVFSDY